MNLDEQTFLTAYLDGELDPEQRHRVDSALVSSPRLSEDLRDLTAVRDLISGLARPAAPADLSAAVIAAIRLRRDAGPLGRVIGVKAASWSSRVVALASAAAALIVTASLGPDRPSTVAHGLTVVTAPSRALSGPRSTPADRAAPADPVRNQTGLASRAGVDPRASVRVIDEREREQRHLLTMLESPTLCKVFLVADVLGGDAGRQVGDLVEKTPRRSASYGRFSVTQGIFVDPEHPGEATVFALIMDDQELEQLRKRLYRSFPDAVEETEPRPEVVTALTEVGQFSVFPGTSAASGAVVANLLEPGEKVSTGLKSRPAEPPRAGFSVVPTNPGFDPLQVPYAEGTFDDHIAQAPGPDRIAGPRLKGEGPAIQGSKVVPKRISPPEASVVLVWVASPPRGRSGAR